jgi:hypothetical protein
MASGVTSSTIWRRGSRDASGASGAMPKAVTPVPATTVSTVAATARGCRRRDSVADSKAWRNGVSGKREKGPNKLKVLPGPSPVRKVSDVIRGGGAAP